jgi:hypothetical protein
VYRFSRAYVTFVKQDKNEVRDEAAQAKIEINGSRPVGAKNGMRDLMCVDHETV